MIRILLFLSIFNSSSFVEPLVESTFPDVDISNIDIPIIEDLPTILSEKCKEETTPQIRNLFKTFYESLSDNEQVDLRNVLPKFLGIMIKESSGNPTAVSDMKGRGSRKSYISFFEVNNSFGIQSRPHYGNIELLEKLLNQKLVTIDKKTNFGLAQLSADRLHMSKWGGDYLKSQAELISNISAKEFLNWCMTKVMFSDDEKSLHTFFDDKIKNCKMSSKNLVGIKCFARTINICPRMAIELSLKQPMSYFETKEAKPICEELFK